MCQKNWKFVVVVSLGIVYFISFWLLTIGYFTPNWLIINFSQSYYDREWYRGTLSYRPPFWKSGSSCNSIGVVTRSCDGNIYDWFTTDDIRDITIILKNAFRLMTAAIVVVYTNAALLILAVVFDLFKSSFYMSLLSISFGVFYPVAAILILIATIYVEAWYTWLTGFSAMICTIAGGLMLIFYFGLIMYDKQYIKRSITPSSKEKGPEQTYRSKKSDKHHAAKNDQSYFKINRYGVNPIREWGLRRI